MSTLKPEFYQAGIGGPPVAVNEFSLSPGLGASLTRDFSASAQGPAMQVAAPVVQSYTA